MRKIVLGVLFLFVVTNLWSSGTVDFLSKLAYQKYVTKADVIKIIAYFCGLKNPTNLKKAVKFLRRKGIISSVKKSELKKYASRGYVAYLLHKALKLKNGIWAGLFGLNRRLAYRQLVKYRIIPSGGHTYYLSGTELIGVIGRANKFRKGEVVW